MTKLGAPKKIIDWHIERSECIIHFDTNRLAYEVFTTMGNADFTFKDEMRGKKVFLVPSGLKAPAIESVMNMMNVSKKKTMDTLRRVRLIEYGYVNDGLR